MIDFETCLSRQEPMSTEEAIHRIREHNQVHFQKEYPRAIYITKALNMACDALSENVELKKLLKRLLAYDEGCKWRLYKDAMKYIEEDEMRLIDADELEKTFCEHCSMNCEGMGHKPMCACAEMYMIDNAPTIEANPIIKAHWVNECDCHRCSNCGAVLEEEFKLHYYAHCYHCGAFMD